MRKQWIKREHIYYQPFYKQKSKMLLLGIFLLGIVFFIYQAFSINQLPNASTPWSIENTLNAVRLKHQQMQMSLGHKELQDDGGGKADESIKIIRGTRLFDYDSYRPNFEHKFKCLNSNAASIPFNKVNDNYCDCTEDGSDEPSTNACPNGRFYCKYQKRHITGRGQDIYVPSSRINDGICDCCDGSDEWTTLIKCSNKCI